MPYTVQQLKPFFEPQRVAVIGASRAPGKGGYNIIENLRRLGFGHSDPEVPVFDPQGDVRP